MFGKRHGMENSSQIRSRILGTKIIWFVRGSYDINAFPTGGKKQLQLHNSFDCPAVGQLGRILERKGDPLPYVHIRHDAITVQLPNGNFLDSFSKKIRHPPSRGGEKGQVFSRRRKRRFSRGNASSPVITRVSSEP